MLLILAVADMYQAEKRMKLLFQKEVIEELNIDVSKITHKVLGTMTPKDGVSAFMKIYEIESDVAPNYNPDDFVSYKWLSPEEIMTKLAEGDTSKDDLPKILKRFYL